MNKIQAATLYRTGGNIITKNISLMLCVAILIIIGVQTFHFQNNIVGFEPGYDELAPKHHGSVSSKGLAIISTATQENGFVGYAVRYKDDQNHIVYDYFDRYPVFFSAIFNRILSLRSKLSSKIYLARQVMNVFYVATLLVAFLICDKLIKHKLLSLTAVLIVFSNPYLLFYKDMVHFDQPALLGFLLLTYAIALYKIDGLKYPVVIATFIAIASGRGYASYAVLGLWLLIEAFLIFKARELSLGQKIKNMIKHPSFILLIIGIVWGGSLLSYNIMVEAKKKNISILQTSIVDSAIRRLSLSEKFNEENEDIINWGDYTKTEIGRIIKWSFPVRWANFGFVGNTLILIVMGLIIGLVIRRQPLEKRIIFLILALAGFVWLIPLRNLAAFHDYTTMYFIGVPLAFYLSLLVLLKPSKDTVYYLALMGMVIYLSGLIQVRDWHNSIAGNASEYTYDFMRIEEVINSQGNNIYLDGEIPFGTNAAEFYLPDQYLAPLSQADYVISWNEQYSSGNLTPNNKVMFLFKKK